MEEDSLADFFPKTASGVAIAGICAFAAATGSLYQVRKLPFTHSDERRAAASRLFRARGGALTAS